MWATYSLRNSWKPTLGRSTLTPATLASVTSTSRFDRSFLASSLVGASVFSLWSFPSMPFQAMHQGFAFTR
jgi:hypothetical protein